MPPDEDDIFAEPDIDKQELDALEKMVEDDPDKNTPPTDEEIAASKAGKAAPATEDDAAAAALAAKPTPTPKVGDDKQSDVPSGFVPHAALHESRLETKLLKQQLADTSARLGVVDQLKAQLDELRAAGKTTKNDDPAPKKEDDPIAYLEWENRQMKRDLDTIKAERNAGQKSREDNVKQQAQVESFMADVRAQVLDFEKATPDYSQAFQHVVSRRILDYQAMGITDPKEIQMTLDREVMSVAATALQRSINPGQAMYALAKNMGYTPAKPADPKTEDKKAGGETLAEQLARIEKGGKAGSMGAGGAAPEGVLTLENIERMTDKEFDEYWDKNVGSNSIYQ